MKNENINWIDWAKFFGIFLVVYGHLIQQGDGLNNGVIRWAWDFIYLFHMPLFFIVSGYLYKRGKSFFLKLLTSLIIPYIVYQILFSFININSIFLHFQQEGGIAIIKHITGILIGDGYNTPFSYYACLPCWFIVCIIQLRLLFRFIRINIYSSIFLSIACIAFLVARKKCSFDLFFCVDCTMMAIPYFLFGYWTSNGGMIKKMFARITNCRMKSIDTCKLLILLLIVVFVYLGNGAAQMIRPSYGNNIILNYIAGFSGSLFIISFACLMKGLPIKIKIISRNTLFLIFYHWVCLLILHKIHLMSLLLLVENPLMRLIEMALVAIVVLYSSLYCIKFLEFRMPVVLGKYKKCS